MSTSTPEVSNSGTGNRVLSLQLKSYQESWKPKHDEVRGCWKCEDTVSTGLSVFRLFVSHIEAWRDRVFRELSEPDSHRDADDLQWLRTWLDITQHVLDDVAGYEAKEFDVERAHELRKTESEAKQMLANWEPAKLASTVGLRKIAASSAVADEVDRILGEQRPQESPKSPMRTLTDDEAIASLHQ